MKRPPGPWLECLRAWGRRLSQRLMRRGGSLWLDPTPPIPPVDLPAWARPLADLVWEAQREGEAGVARLAARLPAGVSALGEWRGDNGDTLRVLAAWRGWPGPPRPSGPPQVNHWLWLANERETLCLDRFAAFQAAETPHAN